MTLIEELKSVQHDGLNTTSSKIIYLILRNDRDATGWTTVSVIKLAKMTGLSLTGVRKILAKLVDLSLVEKERSTLGANKTSKYRVLDL